MGRPMTKFGELKRVLLDNKLLSKDIDDILQKCIDELKARTPVSPVNDEVQ